MVSRARALPGREATDAPEGDGHRLLGAPMEVCRLRRGNVAFAR
jgi:hypothetical protein